MSGSFETMADVMAALGGRADRRGRLFPTGTETYRVARKPGTGWVVGTVEFGRVRRTAVFAVESQAARYVAYMNYEVTDEHYARLLADPVAALAFVEECRRREHDDLLMQQPGWNRGIPY